jgi:hypothetical protein
LRNSVGADNAKNINMNSSLGPVNSNILLAGNQSIKKTIGRALPTDHAMSMKASNKRNLDVNELFRSGTQE